MDFGDFQAHLHICITHGNVERQSAAPAESTSKMSGSSKRQTIRKKFSPEAGGFI